MVSAAQVRSPEEGPVTSKPLSEGDVEAFARDGFVILPDFFAKEEIAPLQEACLQDPTVGGRLRAVADSDGHAQEIIGWSAYSDDYLGMVTRLARLVAGAQRLLGRPVYQWHSKLSMKRPRTPGRWDWHQDYPYWYKEGCLLPDMLTAMIAVDPLSLENGCVQLVRGSHLAGRIDHVPIGQSVGCDPVRLTLLRERLETVAVELSPGDVCFFHANTLHASGANLSDGPRTILHISYNTVDNSPFIEDQEHHAYRPYEVVPDEALAERRWASIWDNHDFNHRRALQKRNVYGYTLISKEQ